MSNINFGRVILGGLVAGLLLNVGEVLLNDVVLGTQMKSFLTAHNFAEPGGSFIALAVGLTFLMGIVLMLAYACIRPRFGPGIKTAIVAGLLGWFGVYCYTAIINGVLFGIPMGTICTVVAFGLVEYLVAAMAGAWLYKEA